MAMPVRPQHTPSPATRLRAQPLLLTLAMLAAAIGLAAQHARAQSTLADGEKPPPAPAAPAPARSEPTRAAKPPATTPAGQWTKLVTERYPGKQDDICFISPSTGWYVNGAGKMFKTTNAGQTWSMQLHKPGTFFRCVAFIDDKTGFAGNIGPGYFPNVTDETPLYRTDDGGSTWAAVTTIDGPKVVGLCAIEVVRTEFVNAGSLDVKTRLVATGRVGSPAAYIHSDDLGKTWQQTALPESCKMTFDVHFTSRDRGFIAGATSADVAEANALILSTKDGGATWTEAYRSARPYELTWKIAFPTRSVGYVTIQAYNPDPGASQRFIAKTTDGGNTWAELPLVDNHKFRAFGVGFVSDTEGWVGGMPGGLATRDGGVTWTPANFGNAVNKIRVVPPQPGSPDKQPTVFAIGVDVHRLSPAAP